MLIKTFTKRIRQWCIVTSTMLCWMFLVSFLFLPLSDSIPTSDSTTYELNDELLLAGVDGPYLFKKRNKIREIRVVSTDTSYEIEEYVHNSNEKSKFVCFVENKEKDSFSFQLKKKIKTCLLYTSPSPRDQRGSRMPSSA